MQKEIFCFNKSLLYLTNYFMIKNVFKYMDLVSSPPEKLECCCQNRLLRVRLAKSCVSGEY